MLVFRAFWAVLLVAWVGVTLATPAAAQEEVTFEIDTITASFAGGDSVTETNSGPNSDSSPLVMSGTTSQPKGTSVTVTFTVTARNTSNYEINSASYHDGSTYTGIDQEASGTDLSQNRFTHNIVVGADDPTRFRLDIYDDDSGEIGSHQYFTFRLTSTAASGTQEASSSSGDGEAPPSDSGNVADGDTGIKTADELPPKEQEVAVAATVGQIDTFMGARSQAIVANQPARGRRTSRLGGGGGLGGIGGGAGGGTLNFNGQTMPLTGVPVSVEISPTRTHMSGSLLEARRAGTLGLNLGEGMESLGRLTLLGLRLAGVDDILGPRSRREVRRNGRRVQVADKFNFTYDQPQRGRPESTPGSLVTGSESLSMDRMMDMAGMVMNSLAGAPTAHDEASVNTTSDRVSPTVATPIAPTNASVSGAGEDLGGDISLAAAQTNAPALGGWDAWFDASFGRYEVDSNQGVFGVFHVGLDRRIGQDLLLGVSAQVDHADGRSGAQEDGIEGTGWMVGPYMTARIYQNFYIDAAGSYGRADNSIALGGGLRADSFGSQRWFVRAALFGDFAVSGWGGGRYGFQPSLDVSRYVETSDSYRDSRGLTIRSSKVELSDVSFGGRLTRTSATGLYSQYVSVDGIWTFEAEGSSRRGTSGRSNLEGGSSTGMRGRLGAGLDFADLLGGSFGMDVSYDGLGRTHYETLTITMGYGRRF